ncbi:MAG: DUF4209 domain-containing protein [Actinobacteria bacterium]|nr:DUF4209 domain-containing protein [Actinomycetota bacterium]
MLKKEISLYLTEIDKNITPIHEIEIAKSIIRLHGGRVQEDPNIENLAEAMAFYFLPSDDISDETYYTRAFSFKSSEDQVITFPRLDEVTEEILDYWDKRAHAVKHPILVCRYADLVVDLYEKVMRKKYKEYYKLVCLVVDQTIKICNQKLLPETYNFEYLSRLKRAVNLAKSIKDKARLNLLKNLILKFDECGDRAFNILMEDKYLKVLLSDDEQKDIISKLENITVTGNLIDIRGEQITRLLARYYQKEGDYLRMMEVLSRFDKVLQHDNRFMVDPIITIKWLDRIHNMYYDHTENCELAKKEAIKIRQVIDSLPPDFMSKSLQAVSVPVILKQEEIEKFLTSIFHGQIEDIVKQIASHFIPNEERDEQHFNDLIQKHPLTFLANRILVNNKNTPVGQLESVEANYDEHLLYQISKNLQIESMWLDLTFEKLKKDFTPQIICDYLLKESILSTTNKSLIMRGLKSFWDSDYLVSNLIFIPLIENCVREVVRICGGQTLKINKINGYEYTPLGSLLGDCNTSNVLGKSWDDLAFYFSIILTKTIGWNIRNDFCHGISQELFSNKMIADRLFHIVLCLSLIKLSK